MQLLRLCIGLVLLSIGPFLIGQSVPDTFIVLSHLHHSKTYPIDEWLDQATVIINGGLSSEGIVHPDITSLRLSKDKKKRLYLVDGAPEWRHGQRLGYERVRAVDEQLDRSVERDLYIGKGCAGPEAVTVGQDILLVFVSSSYLLHSHYKPQNIDTDCDYLYHTDIYAELEDMLDDAGDRQVLLITYHSPLASRPPTAREWLLPYDGRSHQVHSSQYRHYRHHLNKVLADHPGTIMLSANERSSAYRQVADLHLVSSWSGDPLHLTIDRDSMQISSLSTGRLLYEIATTKEKKKLLRQTVVPKNTNTQKSIAIGPQYKANWLQRGLVGANYREEWTTPVRLPVLDIDTTMGGLRPYKRGGGNQTQSLRFKASNGLKYNFRSVDKDARRNPDNVALQSIYGGVKQDQISSQLPFGDVFAGHLLDYSDILHVTPSPFILDNDSILGDYQEDFGGMVGTLELRPAGVDDIGEELAFGAADKIISSHQLYRRMLSDGDHQIDALAWAKAVLFSIWIADWDRHQDNYKWAAYRDGKSWVYRPIPRDRDHVLALWEGIIGNLGDQLAPNVAEFSPQIRDIAGLTHQGRAIQHFMAHHVSRQQWSEAATYLQSIYNKDVIKEAWSHMPRQIRRIRGRWVRDRLLSRLDSLDVAAAEVYRHLNHRLDIYSSNKDDYLTITALPDSTLQVEIHKEKKGKQSDDPYYSQIFDPSISTEINFYLLDGDDIVCADIPDLGTEVRVILGRGSDRVLSASDHSTVRYYDTDSAADPRITILQKEIQPSVYDFNYDAFLATPYVLFDSDFGLGGEVLLTKYVQKWDQQPYGTRHRWAIRLYPENVALRIGYKRLQRNVVGDWHSDVYIRGAYRDTRYDNFTGINTAPPVDFAEQRRAGQRYYVANSSLDSRIGLRREFFGKSDYRAHLGIHYVHINHDDAQGPSILGETMPVNIQAYHRSALRIDVTDRSSYPTGGQLYEAEARLGYTFTDEQGIYYLANISALKATSWTDVSKTIILAKVGASYADGELRYFNYPTVGNSNNLRGTFNNIIRTDLLYYINTELRKEVWSSRNIILPFTMGVSAHYDYIDSRDADQIETALTAYGYGGGLYATFMDHAYSVYCTYSDSSLGTGRFVDFGVGFRLR